MTVRAVTLPGKYRQKPQMRGERAEGGKYGAAPRKGYAPQEAVSERAANKNMQEGGDAVSNTFMTVDEVAVEMGVSKSYAYKIIRRLNQEMKELGYLTISGRVNKQYFMKKVCYEDADRKGRT